MNTSGIKNFFHQTTTYTKAFISGCSVGIGQFFYEASHHDNTERSKIINYLLDNKLQNVNHIESTQHINDGHHSILLDSIDEDIFHAFPPEHNEFLHNDNLLINVLKNGCVASTGLFFHNTVMKKSADALSKAFETKIDPLTYTTLFLVAF